MGKGQWLILSIGSSQSRLREYLLPVMNLLLDTLLGESIGHRAPGSPSSAARHRCRCHRLPQRICRALFRLLIGAPYNLFRLPSSAQPTDQDPPRHSNAQHRSRTQPARDQLNDLAPRPRSRSTRPFPRKRKQHRPPQVPPPQKTKAQDQAPILTIHPPRKQNSELRRSIPLAKALPLLLLRENPSIRRTCARLLNSKPSRLTTWTAP